METASWIEIVWTTETVIGSGASLYNLFAALGDFAAAKRKLATDDDRREYARASVRREIGYVFALTAFAFVGAQALFAPEPPPSQVSPTLRMIYLGLFIIAAGMLSANSVLDAQERRRDKRKMQMQVGLKLHKEDGNG